MKKSEKRLPGAFTGMISYIPMINWVALIILGMKCAHKTSIVFGIIWGLLTFIMPDKVPYIWIIVMIQYVITKRKIEDEYIKKKYIEEKIFNVDVSHYANSSNGKFINDMKKFEDKSGAKVPFVPFMAYWPTYDSMDQSQKAWYFYWRTEARKGNYPDTDLTYIFIYVYELLSGIGWEDAQEGYSKLMTLWMQYRERYPKLDNHLLSWTFDFSWLHNLEYIAPDLNDICLPYQHTIKDILIDKHREDKPLKLPFSLIDSLCEYSLTGSKFYKDGHQLLMQEALPRVVALVDASLIKKNNLGILSIYGPNRSKKQSYILFQSAVCPDANKRVDISVKAYTSSQSLRAYMNEIVRFSENVLRAIYGYRGRLRGVTVDEETAALIEKFLKKEYSLSAGAKDDNPAKKVEVELDFNSINELRKQSDAVRDALEVSEDYGESKELLTDLEEVRALLETLSDDARLLIDYLVHNDWQCENDSDKTELVNEINMQANKYLACILIVLEQELLIIEDDYRDELAYLYSDQSEGNKKEKKFEEQAEQPAGYFKMDELSEPMRQVIENLAPEQMEILTAVLEKELIQEKLARIAEKEMSMPEIMIDEINDTATQYLDDILIDTFGDEVCVLEQYEEELKRASTALH